MSILITLLVITILYLIVTIKQKEQLATQSKLFLDKYLAEQDLLVQLRVDNEQLLKGNKELQEDLFKTQDELGLERDKIKNVISSKKSSEAKLGIITENLVPILQGLPYDSQNLRHLGSPIDYVYFNFADAEIVFVEVKSGNSQTSKRQKLVKNIIKSGKVYFEELRVNESGIVVKRTKNID